MNISELGYNKKYDLFYEQIFLGDSNTTRSKMLTIEDMLKECFNIAGILQQNGTRNDFDDELENSGLERLKLLSHNIYAAITGNEIIEEKKFDLENTNENYISNFSLENDLSKQNIKRMIVEFDKNNQDIFKILMKTNVQLSDYGLSFKEI